jgi:hypothetical protein
MGRLCVFIALAGVLLLAQKLVSQSHFVYTHNTGNNASISVPSTINPSINGQTLAIGDEIGVFAPTGLCVGAIVWTGENNVITAWGNNPYNDVIDGLQPGEQIHYRIWRQSTNTEYSYVEKEYSMGNGSYIVNGLYILSKLNALSAPSSPTLSSPANNQTDVTINLTLNWNVSSRAESYTLQVSKNQSMSQPIINQGGLTGTSYDVNGLDYETKYYWRVRAVNGAGNSNWSETWSFTTEILIVSINIQLQSGWNMVSSRIAPVESSIEAIFSDIVSDVVLVKTGDGKTYWPAMSVNQIGGWDYKYGYHVYMSSDRVLTILGTPLTSSEKVIQLAAGWNMVAYLSESAFEPAVALESLGNNLFIAKSNSGGVYWPQFGVNTIGTMLPGQGYQVYLQSSGTLTYPDPETSPPNDETVEIVSNQPEYYTLPFNLTGFNATILFMSSSLTDGDEVGVYTLSEGNLVGNGVFSSGKVLLTVWGNDEVEPFGAAPGEALLLSYYSAGENREVMLQIESVTDAISGEVIQNELTYKHNGVYIITGSALTSVEKNGTVPVAYMLGQNYPNPFNPSTTIRFVLPEPGHTTLKIFDITGREVATLVDESMETGEYSVQWHPSNLPTGMYVYRLRSGNFADTKKLTMVK